MSLLTALHAARRGVSVATEGINVVGHNTANATTEGYTRRSMSVSTMYPLYRNGSWLGQGPSRPSFQRTADVFVDQNLIKTSGFQSESKEAYNALRLIEARLNDGMSNGVVQSYQNFIQSLRTLSDSPHDVILQDQTISTALNFTNAVQDTANFLNDQQFAIEENLEQGVDDINVMINTIAELNRRIKSTAGTVGAGDIQDQRDLVIRELADLTGAQVRYEADGQAIVFIDGHAIVQEEHAREFVFYEDSNGDPQFAVSANAGKITITDELSGTYGGRLQAYRKAAEVSSDLDAFVNAFAADFNAQHQAGFDINANTGLDFFSFNAASAATSLTIDSNLVADTSRIAMAGALNASTGFPDAGDKSNLDLLIAVEDVRSLGPTNNYTPRQFLTNVYASLAKEVANAESNYAMHSMKLEDINELRSSISGVNLDEEAIKLMQYQASYEAAARVISVTNSLLGELMDVV